MVDVAIRTAVTDADLEAWRSVRLTVLPNEPTPTVAEMRRRVVTPERLLLLAESNGTVIASGVADRADQAGRAFVAPRVLPSFRRLGVGTRLLHELASHIESLGYEEVGGSTDDPGSLAFAEAFGFRETDRQIEQVKAVGGEPRPLLPNGVDIVSIADAPDLWSATYETVAQEAFADMALDAPLAVTREQWVRDWIARPEAMFVAVAAGEVIGCAGLVQDEDVPERAENALTAVRRDWRGRGVATALKRTALAHAAANGITEVYTWTQLGNDAMRGLNERLGYTTRAVSITVRAPLPLRVTSRTTPAAGGSLEEACERE